MRRTKNFQFLLKPISRNTKQKLFWEIQYAVTNNKNYKQHTKSYFTEQSIIY